MDDTTAEWRKAKAAQLGGLERRELLVPGLELRDGDGGTWTLTGFASVTGVDYPVGAFVERIEPGAFKRTLSENPDVQLLVNHAGLPLSRTRSGTLRLEERSQPDASGRRGLWIEADLDQSDPDAQLLAGKLRRGLVDAMSFAFQVTDDVWTSDYSHRSVKTVNLNRGDVSVVNQGANPAASAQLRSADLAGTQRSWPSPAQRLRERRFLAGLSGSDCRVAARPSALDLAGLPDYTTRARERLEQLQKGWEND